MTATPFRPTGGLARRSAALCGLVAASWVLGAGWAGAAGAAATRISLDPGSGSPGTVVTVRGGGFCGRAGCAPVDVSFAGQPAASGVRVAADGTFRATFRVPGGGVTGVQNVAATQRLADGNELTAFAEFDLVLSKGEAAERAAEERDLEIASPQALSSDRPLHGATPLAAFVEGGSGAASPPGGDAAGRAGSAGPAGGSFPVPLLVGAACAAAAAAVGAYWWNSRRTPGTAGGAGASGRHRRLGDQAP